MRLLFFILAALLLNVRAWPAPTPSIFGRLSIDPDAASAEVSWGSGGAMKREGGMYLSMDSFGVGCWHYSIEAENWEAFAGSASIEGGFALRTKPYAFPAANRDTLWSAKNGATASSHVFGIASRGLSLLILCETDEAAGLSAPTDLPRVLGESLRFAGSEYFARFGELSAGLAASVADKPRTSPGDGWKAGESFEQGSSHIVLASAARLRAQGFLAGAWVSGSAGYLESPGWAASLEVEALGGTKQRQPALKLAAYIFGSSAAYLSSLGTADPYDFLADARGTIRIEAWSFAARWVVGSLKAEADGTGKRHRVSPDIPALDYLTWLWKLDQARAYLDLGFDALSLAARLNADAGGLKYGSVSLRWGDVSGTAAAKSSLDAILSVAVSARLARDGGIVDESTGEIGEESGEDSGADNEIVDARPGFSSGLNLEELRLGALGFECGLGWGGAHNGIFEKGKAQLIVTVKIPDKEKPEIALSGSVAQKLRVGDSGLASISVRSPKGGYGLGATAWKLPLLELSFSM